MLLSPANYICSEYFPLAFHSITFQIRTPDQPLYLNKDMTSTMKRLSASSCTTIPCSFSDINLIKMMYRYTELSIITMVPFFLHWNFLLNFYFMCVCLQFYWSITNI